MSFPRYERYKESGVEWLGEVPEGWEVKRFKSLVNSIKAGPFGSALTKDIINISILSEIFLVVPPLDEQSAIAAFLGSETIKIDALVGEAQQAIGLLKERRSALISAAVTGKIDVRQSDRSDKSDSSEGRQTP